MEIRLTHGTPQVEALLLDLGADGRAQLKAARLSAAGLRLAVGAAELAVEQAELTGVAATLAAPAGSPARVEAVSVEAVKLQGLHVALPAAAWRGTGAAAGMAWRLDALGGLQGVLNALITDAAWVLDADVRMPIDDGRLDFNHVTVEHLGPDSSMGVSHMGVYVDAPNGRSYLYMFSGPQVPGISFERRGALFGARVTDRGSLDVRAFAECLLRHLGSQPVGWAPHQTAATLDRTRLDGTLQLGDGAFGTVQHHLVLDGRARGHNRIELSAAVVSHELTLRWLGLSAREARFEVQGRAGQAGPVTATLRLQASGLGLQPRGRAPEVTVDVESLTLQRLAWGQPLPAGS
jgi:hypothetical protein